MAKKKNSNRYYNDIALQLSHKVLGLEYLHYGYFCTGTPATLETLPQAQRDYVNALLGSFPNDVKIVLDVGCGVGGVATKLLERNYNVTCLDPDPFMIQTTLKKTNNQVTAYNDFYENVDSLTPKSFDLVLMSESCQYINPEKGWTLHAQNVRPGGYVVAADFFKMRPIDAPYISKSGHDFEKFIETAKAHGFSLIEKKDITAEVAPTMDIYQAIISNKIFPIMEAVFEVIKRRWPSLYKVLSLALKEKVLFLKEKYSHQSAAEFTKYKSYFILVFKKNI